MPALQHQQLLAQTKVLRDISSAFGLKVAAMANQKSEHLRPRSSSSQQERLSCDLSTQNPPDHVLPPYMRRRRQHAHITSSWGRDLETDLSRQEAAKVICLVTIDTA
jgi:hypothetical protein